MELLYYFFEILDSLQCLEAKQQQKDFSLISYYLNNFSYFTYLEPAFDSNPLNLFTNEKIKEFIFPPGI